MSSFDKIRSNFVHEVLNKIAFMERYLRYEFTPFDFSLNYTNLETTNESINRCERSLYVEQCEGFLAYFLKL